MSNDTIEIPDFPKPVDPTISDDDLRSNKRKREEVLGILVKKQRTGDTSSARLLTNMLYQEYMPFDVIGHLEDEMKVKLDEYNGYYLDCLTIMDEAIKDGESNLVINFDKKKEHLPYLQRKAIKNFLYYIKKKGYPYTYELVPNFIDDGWDGPAVDRSYMQLTISLKP